MQEQFDPHMQIVTSAIRSEPQRLRRVDDEGTQPSLQYVACHLVEERHSAPAKLLVQSPPVQCISRAEPSGDPGLVV